MEYLKVWTSFREVISPLNDAEKGRLFDAMLLYAETGEEPQEFRGNERFLWPSAKQDIDRMALKSQKNSENGSRGGRPKSEEKRLKATESEFNRVEAIERHKVNIKKDKEKEIVLTDNKEKRFVAPTVEEVSAYCRERGNNVDAQKFVDFYTSKGWKVGSQAMKDWRACVRTWEKNNYGTSKHVAAQEYSQRDYSSEDQEALLRMIQGGV